jgi:hypothetical protein
VVKGTKEFQLIYVFIGEGATTMTAWGYLELTPKKISEGGQNSVNKVLP